MSPCVRVSLLSVIAQQSQRDDNLMSWDRIYWSSGWNEPPSDIRTTVRGATLKRHVLFTSFDRTQVCVLTVISKDIGNTRAAGAATFMYSSGTVFLEWCRITLRLS